MTLSQLVSAEVTKRFSPGQAKAVREILENTRLPFLDTPSRERERQRVQLAALKYADGDTERLREAAKLASTDWRDLLMATGLGNGDWPAVLEREGFAVPR